MRDVIAHLQVKTPLRAFEESSVASRNTSLAGYRRKEGAVLGVNRKHERLNDALGKAM